LKATWYNLTKLSEKMKQTRLSIVLIGIILFTATFVRADIYYFRDGGEIYYTNIPAEGRIKVRLPLKTAKAKTEKTITDLPLRKTFGDPPAIYEPAIIAAGKHYSVDSKLIRAVIKAGSDYNPRAVSPKGAMGLMQLMPATAREMRVADPFDPAENIHGGVRYLGQLIQVLNGDLQLALAAYNAGPAVVMGKNKIPAITETKYYVRRVLNYYKSLKGENGI
jgi:soluble lytic murein transglycosylase-like protein